MKGEIMGKVISICNQKGGVGKTTTTIALAAALKMKGYKVLAIDCDDGNASLTKNLGFEPDEIGSTLTDLMMFQYLERDVVPEINKSILHSEEGFDVIASDSKLAGMTNMLSAAPMETKNVVLKKILKNIKDDYDYVIIDTAPTLNVLIINALAAADEVVIVTQSQAAAEAAVGELIQTIISTKQHINPAIRIKGLLINMLDTRTRYEKDKSEYINDTYSELGMRVFESKIPRAVAAAKCVDAHKSILTYDIKSPASQAYIQFAEEMLAKKSVSQNETN